MIDRTKSTNDAAYAKPVDWVDRIRARYIAAAAIRRGVCLLNAGQFTESESAFREAERLGATDQSLPAFIAACLLGRGDRNGAVEKFAQQTSQDSPSTAAFIRHALSLAAAGRPEDGIKMLRSAIQTDPENAELHFQLGTLLASLERYEEAELRFTQTLNIEPAHSEAAVNLAMCCGVRAAPLEAVQLLQRAQALRPFDARIGLLFAQASRAVRQQGLSVRVSAVMPTDSEIDDSRGIEELSHVVEAEPDFVDAFLTKFDAGADREVFAVLAQTLQAALERQPEQSELHYHCGRVLDRLGLREDAIEANERAVALDPRFTKALIELAKLYKATDRAADATNRLEQAIRAGAEYADVYYLLGQLHRDQGRLEQAETAFRKALSINVRYEDARQALAALASA